MTDSKPTFRTRRKMDRVLILLFFVDFAISIVLCFLVSKTVDYLKDVVQVVCDSSTQQTDPEVVSLCARVGR
jgi:hypothetical protein